MNLRKFNVNVTNDKEIYLRIISKDFSTIYIVSLFSAKPEIIPLGTLTEIKSFNSFSGLKMSSKLDDYPWPPQSIIKSSNCLHLFLMYYPFINYKSTA